MIDWTPETIKRARARLLRDISPEALEKSRREREHIAAWGNPKRCKTGQCAPMGECLFCGAINGESCIANPHPGDSK